MTEERTLSIAADFGPFPAGRVEADGPYNGEKFREEYLVPALKSAALDGAVLVISLDGLKSCGSSFLESAFGGLVRYNGFTAKKLQTLIRIECKSASLERYKIAIENHIKRAVSE